MKGTKKRRAKTLLIYVSVKIGSYRAKSEPALNLTTFFAGMVIVLSLLQSAKADSPINAMLSGIVMLFNFWQ